jgi:hypothetical protein
VRFNLVSNLANGCGLQQDYELLRKELEARGHQVQGVQFNQPARVPKADVNIFLEVVNPLVFQAAPVQWAVPNPEWWFSAWTQHVWHKVLAKTRDCERIFRQKCGDRCQYLGWTARDLYVPTIPRERKFLHVAGKSQFKNTTAVVEGCHQAGVPLTVVGEHVFPRRRVSDKELIYLMNSHFCHLMPSAYEGYGQVLHESMGVGQVIVTTDAPPMNELSPVLLVPSVSTRRHHEGLLHKVSSSDVAKMVKHVLNMPPTVLQQLQDGARTKYHEEQQAFQQALDALVGRAS